MNEGKNIKASLMKSNLLGTTVTNYVLPYQGTGSPICLVSSPYEDSAYQEAAYLLSLSNPDIPVPICQVLRLICVAESVQNCLCTFVWLSSMFSCLRLPCSNPGCSWPTLVSSAHLCFCLLPSWTYLDLSDLHLSCPRLSDPWLCFNLSCSYTLLSSSQLSDLLVGDLPLLLVSLSPQATL